MHSTVSPYRPLHTGLLRQDVRPLVLRGFALLAAGALTLLACTSVAHSQQLAPGPISQTASLTQPPPSMPAQTDKFSAARLPTAEAMRHHIAAAEPATARLSQPRVAGLPKEAGAEPGAAAHHGDVTVHGHWVIELRDKDGTLSDRREFDNSYVGGYFMGLVLSGIFAPIDPAILVSSQTNTAGSWCNGAYENFCTIFNNSTAGHGGVDSTPSTGLCISQCYTGLVSTLTPDGLGGFNSYVLLGTITAVGSGTFDTVTTSVGQCYNNNFNAQSNISSLACYDNAISYDTTSQTNNNYYNNKLTGTNIGTMTVTAGQVLTFKVTISFS